jgi:hypothetical protein
MAELNKDNLENALNGASSSEVPSLDGTKRSSEVAQGVPTKSGSPTANPSANTGNSGQGQVSKEEEIGFHKGALNTLVNERNELVKIIQNVEAVMQAHIARLEQLGVKVPVQGQK